MTGSTYDNTLEGGAGDDTFYASDGTDTIKGQADNVLGDTLDYTSWGGASNYIASGFIYASDSGSLTKSTGGVDSYSGIENLNLSGNNDSFTMVADALQGMSADGNTIDGGSGTDTVIVNELFLNNLSDLAIDGNTMANVFSNIEEIDLSNASLNMGDDFYITDNDVNAMTGGTGTGTLTLTISSPAFSLNIDDIALDGAGGNQYVGAGTYNFVNGTTLIVQSAS